MTPETTRPGRGTNLVGAMLERRYRVDSLIARGGMSAVYRGLDTRLDRPVALKVMDPQYSGDRSFVARFELEARSAAKLHHPDVVAVYDQGVDREIDGDQVYLVMQLVEGCTLRDLMRDQGRLSLPMALSVLEPMLSALGAAHRAAMVHRDIKPENVLIGLDGSVKVADFGLVRAAASAGTTSGSVILGTVAYLSPEQVTTGAADSRTDIYSAGVVLYEMLTGEPPYVGDTALSVAYRHVNDDVPAPSERVPELPPAIDDLVLRATRRDPAVRPADAASFLSEVRQVRANLGIELVGVPVPASEEKTARVAVDNGPPTDQFPAVPAAPGATSGPQGTRALQRPGPDADETQEMAAVRAEAPAPPASARTRHADERRRGSRVFGAWAGAVVVLAALIGLTAWWLGTGSSVEVPRVVGQPEAVAHQVLSQAELSVSVVREHHNTVPEGTVISSTPKEGTKTVTGKEVQLVVSLGRPKVPSIAEGATVEEAKSALLDAKLRPELNESVNRYHPSVPEGQVIGVQPGPGTALDISSPVTLIVSKGPQPVDVPDVRGMTRDNAFATLRNAGFEPYEAARRFDADVEADHVIGTDPAIGTEVLLTGTPRVGVVLSNAVTVPDFSQFTVDQAKAEAARLGLNLEVHQWWQRPDAVIFGQLPFAGKRVEPGTSVQVSAADTPRK